MKLSIKCFAVLLALCISHSAWAQDVEKTPLKGEEKDKAAVKEDSDKKATAPIAGEKKAALPERIKKDRFARESEVDARLRALERRTKVQQKTIEDLQNELAETKEKSSAGIDPDGESSDYGLEDVTDDLDELRGRLDELVSISGYYDFEYSDATRGSRESFRQHHVSIFLSRKLGQFRFFTEIEFEDATNFNGNGDGTFNESDGVVKVESAWGQWEPRDWFKVRAGFILIPHWYHINHFPYLTNTTLRPNFIRRIVPFQTNGVMLHGTYYFENSGTETLSDFGLTYYAYVGNGRTSNPGKGDDDHNKNLGGRVVFHLPRPDWIRKFNLGFGTYIEDDSSKARDEYERMRTCDLVAEFVLGDRGLFRYLGVRAEYEYSRVQVKGAKDFFKEGVYVEPYLGMSLFNMDVIVFARHERTDLNSRLSTGQAFDGHRNFLGFRFFPHPYVSLKAEVFREYTEDDTRPNREGLVLAFVINF